MDSPIYEALSRLYVESGHSVPSTTGPWSKAELEMMLGVIDRSELSKSSSDVYDYVRGQLSKDEMIDLGKLGVDFGVDSYLEAYLQTNTDMGKERTDWCFDLSSDRPFFGIRAEAYGADNIYLDFEPGLSITYIPFYGYGKINSNIPLINDFDHLKTIDVTSNFPMKAMVSGGSDFWSMTLGRDRLSWGQGKTGNLVVSDNLPYYDFFRFNIFNPKLKYTYLVSSFPHKLDYYVDGQYKEILSDEYRIGGLNLYIAHRLEGRFFKDRLSVIATEAIMYSDEDGNVRLSALNPLSALHNFFMRGKTNSTLALELNYTPVKNVNLYAQGLLDDLNVGGESGIDNRAVAVLVGGDYSIPKNDGILKLSAEFAYVDPYTYLRCGTTRENFKYGIDYIVSTRMYSQLHEAVRYQQYVLGYPEGPDNLVGYFAAEYSSFGKYKIGADLLLRANGNKDMYTVYHGYDSSTAPSTTPAESYKGKNTSNRTKIEYSAVVGVNGEYQVNSWLKAYSEFDVVAVRNRDNMAHDFEFNCQLVAGIKLTY